MRAAIAAGRALPNRRTEMGSNGDTLRGSIGLLVLRAGMSAMLFCGHGWDKFTHLAARAQDFPDPLHLGSAMSLGLAVFAEGVCTVFVAIGLFTRWAVIPIVILFVVIVFIHSAQDPWKVKELAALYLVSFVAVFLLGPGSLALDSWISLRMGPKKD
jgi:putative oxidoreductase